MARLTRKQSQARTREKLLEAAYEVVARDGYGGATIEKISEEAGFSKGAFYSNFASKEEIFLQLLESHAGGDIEELSVLFAQHEDPQRLIEALGDWADQRASNQRWGLLAIEAMRMARRNEALSARYKKLFQEQWEGLGQLLIKRFFADTEPPASAFYLGGIIFDITYGGISSFLRASAPGEMVKLSLRSLYTSYGSDLSDRTS